MPLSVGEIAYTSGISDIYPANIPIAKVLSVNTDNNSPFQDVVVEILANLNNLNYVFVIHRFLLIKKYIIWLDLCILNISICINLALFS